MPKYPESQLEAVRQYLSDYLSQRKDALLIGEFIDEIGCRGNQFGLAGTCFGLYLGRTQNLSAPVLTQCAAILSDALGKVPSDRSPVEAKLAKDYGRITSKTIIALLVVNNEQANAILQTILERGVSNDLIRPVLDDPAMSGDVLVTAYVLHILHVCKMQVEASQKATLKSIASRLRSELLTRSDSLSKQLFVSSALCLFDPSDQDSWRHHEWLLSRLFTSRYDFHGDVVDSPFIESFYEDGNLGRSARMRYLRVPTAYAILVSIYIGLRNEKHFFQFPGVKSIVRNIAVPYANFVRGDRSRSAVYHVFFLFLTLFPSQYFAVPTATRGKYFRYWRQFYFGHMNWANWLGLLVGIGCLIASIVFLARGLLAEPVDRGLIGYAIGLFIFGFVGWVIRSAGSKKE